MTGNTHTLQCAENIKNYKYSDSRQIYIATENAVWIIPGRIPRLFLLDRTDSRLVMNPHSLSYTEYMQIRFYQSYQLFLSF